MTQIIDDLRRDHYDMSKLLNLLEEQLGLFHRQETLDFEVLRSIMEYALHYPDLCHHPKEELIFRKLVARAPAWLPAVDMVRDEHRRLADMVRRCAAAVHSVLLDAALPREWFERIVREYISLLRQHMEEEERELFPRTMQHLTESDWREIDSAVHQSGGDLFDNKLEHHYRQLQKRILRLGA